MARTSIDWTEMSWNPCTGCTKISPGCANCYAEKLSHRLKAMGLWKYRNGFRFTMHRDALGLPYTWRIPKKIFVNSMSDLFHADISIEFIQDVFRVMNENPRHIFQVLTKRADVLRRYKDKVDWTPNIWMGVTIENKENLSRLIPLRETSARIKFVSFEPLIGPMGRIDLQGIDWVIVGGESGRGSRSMEKEWVEEIRQQCKQSNIPFFFKQWGGFPKKKAGHSINGRIFHEMPKFSTI